jgi:hypothetical protein
MVAQFSFPQLYIGSPLHSILPTPQLSIAFPNLLKFIAQTVKKTKGIFTWPEVNARTDGPPYEGPMSLLILSGLPRDETESSEAAASP